KVALEIPWRRQTSSVLAPASCSRSTPMICSSLKRLPFIARLLFSGDGLYLISAEFSGCRPSGLLNQPEYTYFCRTNRCRKPRQISFLRLVLLHFADSDPLHCHLLLFGCE